MKVTNIQWDYDWNDLFAALVNTYPEKTVEELKEYMKHHPMSALEEFKILGLPNEIEVPDGMTDAEDISDWLSDEYGFCHNGFYLDDD